MAIKGKSRSRGAKTVARGPKPVYVPVRTPLLRRRGLWISVVSVLVTAAVAGLIAGFVRQAATDREEDEIGRMTEAVSRYRDRIEPILTPLGAPQPPTGFDAFAQMPTALTTLEEGDPDEEALAAAATIAEDTAAAAAEAAAQFEAITPTDFIRGEGFPTHFALYLIDARNDFLSSLQLYRESARLVALAVETEDAEARELITVRARGVHDTADELFARAYTDYVEAQATAESFEPTFGAPGATGG